MNPFDDSEPQPRRSGRPNLGTDSRIRYVDEFYPNLAPRARVPPATVLVPGTAGSPANTSNMNPVRRPRVRPAAAPVSDLVAPPAPGIDGRLLVLRRRLPRGVRSVSASASPTPQPPPRLQTDGLRPAFYPNYTFEGENGTPIPEDDATSSVSTDDVRERTSSVSLDEGFEQEDSVMTDADTETDTETDTDTVVDSAERDSTVSDGSSIYGNSTTDEDVTPHASPAPTTESTPVERPLGTSTLFDMMTTDGDRTPRALSTIEGHSTPRASVVGQQSGRTSRASSIETGPLVSVDEDHVRLSLWAAGMLN